MNQKPPAPPRPAGADPRAERLAAALRENLKRRKAQGKARETAPPPAPQSPQNGDT